MEQVRVALCVPEPVDSDPLIMPLSLPLQILHPSENFILFTAGSLVLSLEPHTQQMLKRHSLEII